MLSRNEDSAGGVEMVTSTMRHHRVLLVCILMLCALISFDIYQTITRADQSAARGFSIIDANIRIEQRLDRIERNQIAIGGRALEIK